MRTRLPALATLLAIGCASVQPAPDPYDVEDGVVVEDGKEDNFLSLSAKEYIVKGRSTVTVEPGAGIERARQLISLKHVAIAWFLNQYLVDKEEDDPNHGYGGFGAMVKTGSYEDLEIVKLDAVTYEFTFAQLIAGRTNLMRLLPIRDGAFTIEIGRPTNEEMARLETNAEWYRQAPWSPWDPAKVPAEKKEALTLAIREERKSTDAWWDYARLFDDGVLDVDVHFGWDYHGAYHIKHARALYQWLVGEKGFRSPVASFDAYVRTSGPLTRTLDANGRQIRVEVRLFYGKPGSEADPDTDAGGRVLEDDVRASLRTRDVIVYSGHSGPFYGFAMANWKKTDEGDFDDSEMLTAEMPADRYQIVVAEGCDTYMIGEAFKQNVYKQGRNVDVITTTSFSNAASPATVEDFLARLVEVDSSGRHRPRTLSALLTDLDSNSYWFHTMYGVHGVDDNPKLHPYAVVENLCEPCARNADCGGPGNACVRVGQSGKVCAAACTDDAGCPSGYACKKIASAGSSTIYASMCVPRGLVCPAP